LPSCQQVVAFKKWPLEFRIHIPILKHLCASNTAASTLHFTKSSTGGCQASICCCWCCTDAAGLDRTSCHWKRDSRASWTTILIVFKSPSQTMSLQRHHKYHSIIVIPLLLSLANLRNKEKMQSAKLVALFNVSN